MTTAQQTRGPIKRQKHGIEAVNVYVTLARADRDRLVALAARERVAVSRLVGGIVRQYLETRPAGGEEAAS